MEVGVRLGDQPVSEPLPIVVSPGVSLDDVDGVGSSGVVVRLLLRLFARWKMPVAGRVGNNGFGG